jgi:uncharacterized phage infection (PIP) family protein YhgE
VVAAASVLALVATGCSSDSEPSELTVWAGSVCDSAASLRTAVGNVRDTVEVDLTQDTDAIDQVKDELQTRYDDVVAEIDALTETLSNPPADAQAELDEASDELQTRVDGISNGIDQITAAIDDAQAAENGREFASALTSVAVPLAASALSARTLAGDIGDFTSSTNEQLQEAFGEAQSCEQFSS